MELLVYGLFWGLLHLFEKKPKRQKRRRDSPPIIFWGEMDNQAQAHFEDPFLNSDLDDYGPSEC